MARRWEKESRGTMFSKPSPELNPSKSIGPRQYSYEQLARATNHFSNNNLLGEGGFGQVYKGLLDGEYYAIKKLKNFPDLQSQGKLQDEIMVVSSVRHKNLVKLLGYCNEGANKLRVFKYFHNKSLSSQLHKSDRNLDWQKRMNIAKGTARGLEYLHEHCDIRIIHLDIKSDNILLDDEFKPKILDLLDFFSNAATHISESKIIGTRVYVDPFAIETRQYSDKSNVYSFGVIFLELITGRMPIKNGVGIVKWAKSRIKKALNGEFADFVDSTLRFGYREMYRMILCADACISNPPNFRPSIKKIFLALEGILSPDELSSQKGLNSGATDFLERRTALHGYGNQRTIYKEKMAEEGKVIACHTEEAWTEQLEKAKRGKQLIVVDFSAAWCSHSRSMSPILAELAKEMPNVAILIVDVNELCSVAMDWAVEAMPTFLFLKREQLLDKVVGANVEQLISTIARHAGGADGILESMTCNLPTMSNSAINPNAANRQWTIPTNYPQPQVLIGTSSFQNPQMLPNYPIMGTNNGFPVNIPATPSTSIDMPNTTNTSTHHCYPYY